MPLKILLVDDVDSILTDYQQAFEQRGFIVQTACDLETALAIAQTFHPDVAVLDLLIPASPRDPLPDSNSPRLGFELGRRLHQEVNSDIGILFISFSETYLREFRLLRQSLKTRKLGYVRRGKGTGIEEIVQLIYKIDQGIYHEAPDLSESSPVLISIYSGLNDDAIEQLHISAQALQYLTDTELDIAQYWAMGLSQKQTQEKMHYKSPKGVEKHRSSIIKTLYLDDLSRLAAAFNNALLIQKILNLDTFLKENQSTE